MTPETREKIDAVAGDLYRWGVEIGPAGWVTNREAVASKMQRAGLASDEAEAWIQLIESPHRLARAEDRLLADPSEENVRELLRVAEWWATTVVRRARLVYERAVARLEEEDRAAREDHRALLHVALAARGLELVEHDGTPFV